MTSIVSGAMLALSSSLAASMVVKATVIAALGLIATWLMRRSRAAVRHAALAAVFGVLLLLPAATLLEPSILIRVLTPAPERIVPRVAAINDLTPPTVAVAAPAPNRPAGLSLSEMLAMAWVLGMALFLLPVAMGLWQVRSLRRSALPWSHGQSAVDELTLDAGIRRRVEVLLHEGLPGPMTCGVVRPAIVLPQDAEQWPEEDLHRALIHELEHVRRGDWVTKSLARALCAVYWFHPLVWIAFRQLALQAERSCDDAVLGRSEATAYADQLVGLAKRLSTDTAVKSPLLAMANRADLSARVGAVLDSRQQRGRAGRISVAFASIAAVTLVLMVAPLRIIAAPQAAALNPKAALMPQYSAGAPALAISPRQILAAPQAAAATPTAAAMPRFSSDTMLVVVDVVVSDQNGNPVEGLRPNDFAVNEDGASQRLSVLEFRKADSGPSYYILGYYASNQNMDGKYRRITVLVDRPNLGVKLEYKNGYYAGRAGFSTPNLDAPIGLDPSVPHVIYKVEPQYSEEARKAKWQGTVTLNVEIDTSGQVAGITVVRNLGLGLDQKAIEAVKQWTFTPGMKNGRPVIVQAEVLVSFRLL